MASSPIGKSVFGSSWNCSGNVDKSDARSESWTWSPSLFGSSWNGSGDMNKADSFERVVELRSLHHRPFVELLGRHRQERLWNGAVELLSAHHRFILGLHRRRGAPSTVCIANSYSGQCR